MTTATGEIAATGPARRTRGPHFPTANSSSRPAPAAIKTETTASTTPTRRRHASLYGIACSLAVHAVLLTSTAWIVLESSDAGVASLLGVIGGSDELPSADFVIDSQLPIAGSENATSGESLNLADQFAGDAARHSSLDSLAGLGSGTGLGEGDGEGEGSTIAGPGGSVPGHAVTKGSFSAWTEPEDPQPGEQYIITIQVQLPKTVKKYRARDISGMVVGTDGYRKAIRFHSKQEITPTEGAVQFQIAIPGAHRLVRDTIRIESKMLHEKQVIKLVF